MYHNGGLLYNELHVPHTNLEGYRAGGFAEKTRDEGLSKELNEYVDELRMCRSSPVSYIYIGLRVLRSHRLYHRGVLLRT